LPPQEDETLRALPPQTVRALLMAPGRIELDAMKRAALAAGEVRVALRFGTICGSDVAYYKRGGASGFTLTTPFVLGHEGAGVVAEVGARVSRINVGDRVAIDPGLACGLCPRCVEGRGNLCPHMRYCGSAATDPPTDGLFATDRVFQERQLRRIPANLPLRDAPLVEPASVALHAATRAGLRAGDSALVIGAGAVGILFLRVAHALGATRVAVVDTSPARREGALAEGAATAVAPQDAGGLGDFDVAAEASGSGAGLAAAINGVRRGGVIVQVGGIRAQHTLPAQAIMAKEIDIRGSFRFVDEPRRVLGLVQAGRLSLSGIAQAEHQLTRISEALDAAASGQHLKVRIRLDQNQPGGGGDG
jgi:L-idonate 5-dehydrogenase